MIEHKEASLVAQTCNVGDQDLTPGSGRSSGERMTTLSSILPWRIPWTVILLGYSLWGCKESDTAEQLTHIHAYTHTHTHTQNEIQV